MKNLKKSIAIITLIFIMCNFFIAPISTVYAESSNVVLSYLTDINGKYNNIDVQILTSKNSVNYINDSSYKYAVDRTESDFISLNAEYENFKNDLGSLLSVKKILTDSGSPLLNTYNEKFTEDVVVDINSGIDDIKYNDTELNMEVILITGLELSNLITSTYFKPHFDKFETFNTKYSDIVSNYQSFYNSADTFYNNSKNDINGYITEINTFITSEKSLGNNPVETGVIDELDSYLLELDSIFKEVLDKGVYNNEFSVVTSKALTSKDNFFASNSNITSDLITDIEKVTNDYNLYKTNLNDLFNTYGTSFDNISYDFVSSLDALKLNDFISLFEKSLDNDSNYLNLKNKIDSYLERRPSEESSITPVISVLNNSYNELNQNMILSIYNNFVYKSDILNEDIVDSLLGYKGLNTLSKEYKYLKNAKNSFYTLKLIDDSKYTISTTDNYLIVDGLDNITKIDFLDNLDYDFGVLLNENDGILDKNTKLELYDRSDEFLRSYNILIKNDINGDGIIDNKDVLNLKEKVLNNNFDKNDKLISDVNNDKQLNINDVTTLNSIVNDIKDVSNATKADFKVIVNETENNVTYNIYLTTDGVVSGFEFNAIVSNNLKFNNATFMNGVSYLSNNNSLRVVGLGSYVNNDLILSITYNKDVNSKEDILFNIENGIVTFDNSVYNDSLKYENIIKFVEEQSNEVVLISNDEDTKLTNNNSDESNLMKARSIEKYDIDKKKSKISEDELNEDDIVLGNVIKLVILVLLGAAIIYFLNQDNETEYQNEKDDKKE